MREQELLDYHPNELTEEDEKNPKKKEKILSGIKKVMTRNHTFQCLSRHAGKGQRDSVKRLHEANENQEIVETHVERKKIEEELMKHNISHFQQAHNTIACNDKTCKELRKDNVRK